MKPFIYSNNDQCPQLKFLHSNHHTVYIFPDYKQPENDILIEQLKYEILNNDCRKNLILVDWNDFKSTDYQLTTDHLRKAARLSAIMILKMLKTDRITFDNIHLICYSLAAHLCGFIGKLITRMAKGRKIHRISGLDPPAYLFRDVATTCRLDSSDAFFVDVYHTASNIISTPEPIGSIDVYINQGIAPQPGCEHDRSGLYIFYNFITVWAFAYH